MRTSGLFPLRLRQGLFLGLAIFLGGAPLGDGAKPKPKPDAEETEGKVSAETKAEILKMEARLRTALETRDAGLLGPLLADHYTDSRGGERVLSKHGAMILCESGKLGFFALAKPRLSQSSDKTIIEGESVSSQKDPRGKAEEQPVHVQRVWARKEGTWLLIAQAVISEEEEEREKTQEKK